MSHTTSIGTIVISDINALRAAISDLKREGVNCNLLENAKPRAYSTGQVGMEQAPYVVQIPDAKYDVGLYMNDKLGGYEARTDFYGGSVERVLGVQAIKDAPADQAKLGKLYQAYAINAAEQQAIMQGYTSTRQYDKESGSVTLTLVAA